MSEPAALDLAAIREWVTRARGIVAGEMGQADWLEALDWEATELGGTVLDALTRLCDDLERVRTERDAARQTVRMLRESWGSQEVARCRAERDALRAAILDIDAHATPLGEDDDGFVAVGYAVSVGAMHRALGLARQAALGEVTQ